jgi:nitrogen fixation protein NifU and related proteins
MQLESMYQEIILDHYKHPHGRGLREPYDAEVHHVNPTCGDEVTLRVAVAAGATGDGGPRVVDVSYDGQGCSISQASTSVLTDLVVGKPVAEALAVYEAFLALMQSKGQPGGPEQEELLEDAVAFAGVSRYPSRIKCALLGWMAWRDATVRAVATVDETVDGALRPEVTEERT